MIASHETFESSHFTRVSQKIHPSQCLSCFPEWKTRL